MRRRALSVIAVSALLATVWASAAGASSGAAAAGRGHVGSLKAFAPGDILYDQTSNDSGVGIVSQQFRDPGFEIYDARGADDFTVPAGQTWTITDVQILGVYFNGSGPARSQELTFYADGGGTPGAVLGVWTMHADDNGGSFTGHLPDYQLSAGTYWLSWHARMPFAFGGEWAWETTNDLHGSAAMWKNPGDGFATGCTTYQNMQNCIGALGEGPDYMFQIIGSS